MKGTMNNFYKLKKGDCVGIVAPSSPFKKEEFNESLNFIKEMGFVPVFNEIIFSEGNYLAGDDKSRAEDLFWHIKNPKIKAIFCARGGYGSIRMLPYLQKLQKKKLIINKPFMGYSDVTSLHLYFYKKTGSPSFYGPNVTGQSFKKTELYQYLMEDGFYINNKGVKLEKLFVPTKNSKIVKGKILGGCLTVIASMVGTGFLPSFKDAVLYIEDINEAPYRIDRLFAQLILSGTLKGIKAIVVGSMKNCDAYDHSWKDTVIDVGKQLKVPVLYGLDAGHENFGIIVPLGSTSHIDLSSSLIKFNSPFSVHKKKGK